VHLTGTVMKLYLCLAWMQTVHIESSCVYPPIRVFMAVGFTWASCWCHSLDTRIMRDFRVDLVLPVIVALRTEEAGGFINAIVRVSEDSIVGLVERFVKRFLDSDLSLFLYFHCRKSMIGVRLWGL